MDPHAALATGTAMAYEHLFVSGRLVDPIDLLEDRRLPCEWSVRILTGPVPDMGGRLLRHRKRFYPDSSASAGGGVVRGVNILGGSSYWGHHVVVPGWGKDGRPATLLNYDVSENSFLTRGIVDRVRVTKNPDILVGKLYVGDWFGGYLMLARIR